MTVLPATCGKAVVSSAVDPQAKRIQISVGAVGYPNICGKFHVRPISRLREVCVFAAAKFFICTGPRVLPYQDQLLREVCSGGSVPIQLTVQVPAAGAKKGTRMTRSGMESLRGVCPICQTSREQCLIKLDPNERSGFSTSVVEVVRCLTCRFVFVRRESMPASVEDAYDVKAQSGLEMNREYFGYWLLSTERALQPILRLLSGEPRGPLLDVGFGRGVFLHLARQSGWPVTGIEINSEAVSFAKSELDLSVFHGTVFSVDLPRNHYSVITLIDVLEHLTDPVGTLKQCAELLRPSGVVVIKVPHWRMQYLKEAIKKSLRIGSGSIAGLGHINQFDRSSLSAAFARAGLTPIGIYPARSFRYGKPGQSLDYWLREIGDALFALLFGATRINVSFNLYGWARKLP